MNVKNDKDKYDEYKEDYPEAPKSDESVINENEEEEALNYQFMSLYFPIQVINYVIGTIRSCNQNMILFGK